MDHSCGRFPAFKCAFLILAAALFLGACGSAQVEVHQELNIDTDFPRTVAVLPFTVNEEIPKDKRPHKILREAFYYQFSYLGFTDMALEKVDLKLADAGIKEDEINKIDTAQLNKILGVDAVIRGHVQDATNFTGGIHAQTTIDAKLEMIDLRSEEQLWRTEHSERNYAGIATPNLVDLIKDQVENSHIEEAYYNVAEVFSQKVLKKIPDPAELRKSKVRLPVIESIDCNIRPDQKLGTSDRIYVSLKGHPGLKASFDIGNWKSGIAMKEVSPGLYTGSYRVRAEDQIDNALIVGTLKNNEGLSSKKFFKDAMAIVTEARAGKR